MGFLDGLSRLFNTGRNQKSYFQMSREELLALSDEDFYFAMKRLNFEKLLNVNDCRNRTHRTYYIVMCFLGDVYNGGISQFFYNESREYAPYISDALKEIGSIKTRNAFDSLVDSAQIPLNDLDALQELEDDETVLEKMDAFDEAFNEDEDATDCLVAYARMHIDDLMIAGY